MRPFISLYQRPKLGTAPLPVCIDSLAVGYQRGTRAVGGYYTGTFDIPGAYVQPNELREFFDTWLGCVFKEHTYGMVTWEGMVYAMNLVQGGSEYFISLESDWFHNSTDVFYSTAAVVDTNQGTLSYTDEAGDDTFTDDAQDFTDWETTSGGAAYRIQVANDDNTTSWAYLGATVAATEIYAYIDEGLTTFGWNGENPAAKTPLTYEVIQVSLEGSRVNTGASDNANSQAEYGTMEYIASLAGASSTSATALRDRHQDEFAWPRARYINQGDPGDDVLTVTLAGFWYTLFWKYRRTSETDDASTLVSNIVGESEFVTAGNIEANTLEVTADAYPIPQRLGDLIEKIVDHGDAAGDFYKCGVYAGKLLEYEQVPTTADYLIRNGRLLDKAGSEVIPSEVRPGFLVRAVSSSRITPPGGATYDETGVTYVDQVEYDRDSGELSLSLAGEPFSVLTLQEQIRSGVAEQSITTVGGLSVGGGRTR